MFVSVLVKMGLSLSLLRIDFSLYRAQAKTLKVSSSEMEMLRQKFKDLLSLFDTSFNHHSVLIG